MQPILHEPDIRLHQVCERVSNFGEVQKIVQDLIDVTKKVNRPWRLWIGMAAPQIGVTKWCIGFRERD